MRKSMKSSADTTATAAPGAPEARSDDARRLRTDTMAQLRRELILDAARAAFFELGLQGASMREIAKRAGYTPGAIYSYFASREEIYAALLGESLLRLNAQVAGAPGDGNAAERVRSKASAFFDFYRDNPRDLDLGFYLFQGVRPNRPDSRTRRAAQRAAARRAAADRRRTARVRPRCQRLRNRGHCAVRPHGRLAGADPYRAYPHVSATRAATSGAVSRPTDGKTAARRALTMKRHCVMVRRYSRSPSPPLPTHVTDCQATRHRSP
jgi:AcrR family transcriptional regulator